MWSCTMSVGTAGLSGLVNASWNGSELAAQDPHDRKHNPYGMPPRPGALPRGSAPREPAPLAPQPGTCSPRAPLPPAAVAAGVSPQAQMVDCSPNCAQTGPVQRAGPWSGLVELQQEQLRPLPGFIKWRQVRRGVLGLLHVLPVLSGRLPISHG